MKNIITAVFVGLAGIGLIGAAPAGATGPYANCKAAHADDRYDIPQSDPDYWPGGDRDNDGVACES